MLQLLYYICYTPNSLKPSPSCNLVVEQVLCYICCAEFGTTSLAIHQKTCLKKHAWGLENNILHEPGTNIYVLVCDSWCWYVCTCIFPWTITHHRIPCLPTLSTRRITPNHISTSPLLISSFLYIIISLCLRSPYHTHYQVWTRKQPRRIGRSA